MRSYKFGKKKKHTHKHLTVTLLKGRKNIKTTTINKSTTKESNRHHKQNKITTTNMKPLRLTDFYRPRHQNYQLVSSLLVHYCTCNSIAVALPQRHLAARYFNHPSGGGLLCRIMLLENKYN